MIALLKLLKYELLWWNLSKYVHGTSCGVLVVPHWIWIIKITPNITYLKFNIDTKRSRSSHTMYSNDSSMKVLLLSIDYFCFNYAQLLGNNTNNAEEDEEVLCKFTHELSSYGRTDINIKYFKTFNGEKFHVIEKKWHSSETAESNQLDSCWKHGQLLWYDT